LHLVSHENYAIILSLLRKLCHGSVNRHRDTHTHSLQPHCHAQWHTYMNVHTEFVLAKFTHTNVCMLLHNSKAWPWIKFYLHVFHPHTHTHAYTYTHARAHTHTFKHTHQDTQKHTHTSQHPYTHLQYHDTHTGTHTHTLARRLSLSHEHAHSSTLAFFSRTNISTHTHKLTQTHTHTRQSIRRGGTGVRPWLRTNVV